MSGVKGRSGRRVKTIQERCYAVRDKAREITMEALENKDIPLLERAKIANPIVAKEIAQRIEAVGIDINTIKIIHSSEDLSSKDIPSLLTENKPDVAVQEEKDKLANEG